MTRFYPIYVRRSDGKLEVAGKAGRLRDKNAPSADQLDRTPNAQGVADYYREIGTDEVKNMDWRRKLAAMLVREIGGKDYEDRQTTCILVSLPENYRLFEHIKSRITDQDGAPAQAKKNHAGGGHDRQDAYLYGHPLGPKKRFRSPADFFPHLLWLCTDVTGNTDNCSCKLCCPEEIEEKKTAAQAQQTPASSKNTEPENRQPAPSRTAVVEIPKRPASNPPPAVSAPPPATQTPVPRPNTTTAPTLTPTPLPPPRSIDQQIDAQYNRFHHRPGEVIWFNKGQAWGLGVILRRWFEHNQRREEVRFYMLQPLSHPIFHPPTATISEENRLRPWLAWSPPPCTHKALADNSQIGYNGVDWQNLVNGKYGPGDAGVDGSILAAKAVDNTFTLAETLKRNPLGNGVEIRWNSMFLGGEKIWIGDPLRLRMGSGQAVMVLLEIIERQDPSPRSEYILVGDIYTYSALESPNQQIPYEGKLPMRMREDLRWRNGLKANGNGTKSHWKLMSAAAKLNIWDVKGRWHELSYLLPLLARDDNHLKQMVAADGGVNEANLLLNSRGDANGRGEAKETGLRTEQRKEAFLRSVPGNIEFVPGIDSDQMQAMQQEARRQHAVAAGHQQSQQHQQAPEPVPGNDQFGQDAGNGALEEFMNLDDDIPGYGQTYTNQNISFF